MIPIHLRLSGFLSYQDPVEIDFTAVDLACISGSNGAGKSSLLDAITWALFGQARKRDDSIINLHPDIKAAEVSLIFSYEGNIYRVQRTAPRGKTNLLEFQILQGDDGRTFAGSALKIESGVQTGERQTKVESNGSSSIVGRSPAGSSHGGRDSESANARLLSAKWKPLTEHTLRETQMRIEQTLRLDYETFVNASFFLQGKADQFTQQRSGDRKRILGSILGLEVWETYRLQAVERRKGVESEISAIDGRLHEISAELGEEDARKARLKELEAELEQISQARQVQETILENIRKTAATLAEQGRLVEALARQTQAASERLKEMERRVEARQKEKEAYTQIIARAQAIEAAYAAWQQARADIEYWDIIAQRLREQEKRRQGPLDEINAARARLQQEQQTLVSQQSAVNNQQSAIPDLLAQLESIQKSIAEAEDLLSQRKSLEANLQEARQGQAEARAENPRLKAEMDHLKERIDQLSEAEGAACPLCGQPLQPEERSRLVEELSGQGRDLGDRFRANLAVMRDSEKAVRDLELQIASLGIAETNLRTYNRTVDQINGRLEGIEQSRVDWARSGAARLEEIDQALETETFAQEARARLAEIDAELKAIGYDAAAHDAARKAEAAGRSADTELRGLEKARAVMAPLEREISELESQISVHKSEVDRQTRDFDEAAARLAAAQAEAPDLNTAERSLYLLQEQENRLRMELGASRQKVAILKDLKARRKALDAQREALARKAGQYKQLERAFGKDGVPALLIEQALPQIEVKANEILERLSGGSMSVRFVTQTAYKDKKRDDLRETLDILISDGAGIRDYELFSGGESFRVNFAIRLALSEVLAQRAGARLQTLVIDEGFGSQDNLGRQKLIEAINLVRPDFAKILVITHIDELKDAFPTRIEVEKTHRGSTLRVI
jgi:exonuclease SbcC